MNKVKSVQIRSFFWFVFGHISHSDIEVKVLNMIKFDDILNVFVDKNWESNAQLNRLDNIIGTLYNYLIVSELFNICKNSVISLFKKFFMLVLLDSVFSPLSYCLLFF